MENIYDLLTEAQGEKLEVRQGAYGSHVPGLTEARVVGVEQACAYLKRGQRNRAAAATTMNDSSSRSHCLLCLRVHGRSKLSGLLLQSVLWAVSMNRICKFSKGTECYNIA